MGDTLFMARQYMASINANNIEGKYEKIRTEINEIKRCLDMIILYLEREQKSSVK